MHSILFVCTANQCRSPMAEGIFRALLKEKGGEADWKIGSAGTWTLDGNPATEAARRTMKARGLDISAHRSKMLTKAMMSGYNLILVMERGHKEALHTEFPESALRVFLLSEMVDQFDEVDDPVGKDDREYLLTAKKIEDYLRRGWERIVRLSADSG